MTGKLACVCMACLVSVVVSSIGASEWSWQEPKAKVLATGDLEWAPQPFVFEQGDSVRYIDFVEYMENHCSKPTDCASCVILSNILDS